MEKKKVKWFIFAPSPRVKVFLLRFFFSSDPQLLREMYSQQQLKQLAANSAFLQLLRKLDKNGKPLKKAEEDANYKSIQYRFCIGRLHVVV